MIKGIHHISMKCGTAEELAKVREFYIELLGLKIVREWADGMMIDTGNGLLEIFTNAEGTRSLGAIRHMALLTDDVDEIAGNSLASLFRNRINVHNIPGTTIRKSRIRRSFLNQQKSN